MNNLDAAKADRSGGSQRDLARDIDGLFYVAACLAFICLVFHDIKSARAATHPVEAVLFYFYALIWFVMAIVAGRKWRRS